MPNGVKTTLSNLLAKLAAIAALALVGVTPASAQWAVFDAGNFTKNTLTALQTAQQYAQLVQSYALQAQQFQNMVTNTKSLGASVFSGAIGRQIASQGVDLTNPQAVSNAAGQLFNIYQNVGGLLNTSSQVYQQASSFGNDMNRMAATTGLSWSDILSQDLQRAQAGQQVSAGLYSQATQIQSSLGDLQARSDANLQAAGQAEGAVQAIQAVALQNHTLSDQMSTLITLSANAQRNTATKDGNDQKSNADDLAAQQRRRAATEALYRQGFRTQ